MNTLLGLLEREPKRRPTEIGDCKKTIVWVIRELHRGDEASATRGAIGRQEGWGQWKGKFVRRERAGILWTKQSYHASGWT